MSIQLSSSTRPFSAFVPIDHFEQQQYVRVCFPNGRAEIGVVMGISDDSITVCTTQGYDINVPRSFVKRAFLLVLDLNGVLVARGCGSFVHRPHVEEFLKFAFSNFVVAVWTSGLKRSSSLIIESVFDGYQDRLLFKLYRDACLPRPTEAYPFGTVKDLQRIFDAYPKSFHSANTILMDDTPCKCSHPDIALCPVPFKDPAAQRDDDGLQRAMETLREVLRLDSHAPLIRAAEERLAELAQEASGTEKERENGDETSEQAQATGPGTATELEQASVWKTRLCCQHLRGCCRRGNCRFSHDPDDGERPCSWKSHCTQGHASRWVGVAVDEASDTEKLAERASGRSRRILRNRGKGGRRAR